MKDIPIFISNRVSSAEIYARQWAETHKENVVPLCLSTENALYRMIGIDVKGKPIVICGEFHRGRHWYEVIQFLKLRKAKLTRKNDIYAPEFDY